MKLIVKDGEKITRVTWWWCLWIFHFHIILLVFFSYLLCLFAHFFNVCQKWKYINCNKVIAFGQHLTLFTTRLLLIYPKHIGPLDLRVTNNFVTDKNLFMYVFVITYSSYWQNRRNPITHTGDKVHIKLVKTISHLSKNRFRPR